VVAKEAEKNSKKAKPRVPGKNRKCARIIIYDTRHYLRGNKIEIRSSVCNRRSSACKSNAACSYCSFLLSLYATDHIYISSRIESSSNYVLLLIEAFGHAVLNLLLPLVAIFLALFDTGTVAGGALLVARRPRPVGMALVIARGLEPLAAKAFLETFAALAAAATTTSGLRSTLTLPGSALTLSALSWSALEKMGETNHRRELQEQYNRVRSMLRNLIISLTLPPAELPLVSEIVA